MTLSVQHRYQIVQCKPWITWMWDLADLCNHAYQVVIKQPVLCSDYSGTRPNFACIKNNHYVYKVEAVCLADENCYSDGKCIGGLQWSDLEDGSY